MLINMAPVEYVYTKLKDLQVGDKYNVYGIITEILKEKGITQKGRLHSICRIKDESLPSDSCFRMHFFIPSHHSLEGLSVGNIVRLHRVKVEEFQGVIDGRVLSGTDVVIFSNVSKDQTYHTDAKSITLTDFDLKRLEELREMLQVENLFEGDMSSLFLETGSQRLAFKGFDQQSGSASHKESERRINGEKKDDSNTNIDDPVSRGSRSKVLNAVCTTGNIRPNPFNSKYQEIHHRKEIPHAAKRHLDTPTTSGVGCKKPSRLEESSPSLNQELNSSSYISQIRAEASSNKKTIQLNSGSDGLHPSNSKYQVIHHRKEIPHAAKQHLDTPTTSGVGCKKPSRLEKSSPHLNQELNSSSYISQIRAEASSNKKPIALNSGSDVLPSEEECPGLACGGKNCALEEIVLLNDDDPLIAEFNENDLDYEGLGDIPAVDEEGNICKPEQILPFGDGSRAKKTTVSDLLQFSWPRQRSKVRLVKIKPNLHSKVSRNLLSGICFKCGTYSLYSKLHWEKGPKTKKAVCPLCFKDGKIVPVAIEFRVKLTVQDAWGTSLDVYAVKYHASTFLGCSAKEYQEEERCRMRVLGLLSETISSKTIFTITLCRKLTMVKSMFYICETNLAEALLQAKNS